MSPDNPDPTRPATAPSIGDAPTVGNPEATGSLSPSTTGGLPAPTYVGPSASAGAPPGYVIEGELGRGGMGVVYLARQHGLNRPVALKMILGDASPDRKAIIRFLAEAEAVAAVRHKNVVEVYHFGEHDGRPFMALEFCPGGSLADALKKWTPQPEQAARAVAAVAEGVAAAHAQGIVHRDLKPHNVLLAADGRPKVTDFGLAKRAAGDSQLTKTNAVMGTPAYMAPEQAGGGTKFVGPPADVWALGVLFYELLCGERPFRGDDTWQVLAAVMKGAVTPLTSVAPGTPRDLDLICRKCLSLDPRDRYPDAGELAADLRRFLAGQAVSVRPAGPVERVVKWARRNKALAAALAVATVAMTAGTAVSLWQAKVAREEAGRADEAAKTAADERDAARFETFRAEDARNAIQLQFAYSNLFAGRDHRAAALRLGDPAKLPEAVRDRWENRLLRGAVARASEPVCRHHVPKDDPRDVFQIMGTAFGKTEERGPVWNWCLSADGTRLAVDSPLPPFLIPAGFTLDGRVIDKTPPPEIRVWDLRTKQPIAGIPTKDKAVCGLAFSPDAKRLAAVCVRSLLVWDSATGQLQHDVPAPKGGSFISVCFSADGKRLFCGGYDGHLRVADAESGKIAKTFPVLEVRKGEPLRVRCLKLTPDGKYLVGGLGRTAKDGKQLGRVVVWDAATGEPKPGAAFADVPEQVLSLDVSRDGKRAATIGRAGESTPATERDVVRVWDLEAGGEPGAGWPVPTDPGRGPAEKNSGNGAFRMMSDIQLDPSGQASELSQVARDEVLQVAFDPTDERLVTTGRDGVLRVWKRDGTAETQHRPPGEYVWQVAWLPDGKLLLGDGHGQVTRFDPLARLPLREFPDLSGRVEVVAALFENPGALVESLALSRDETRLVASTFPPPTGKPDGFAHRRRKFTVYTLAVADGRGSGKPVAFPEPGMTVHSDGARTVVAGEWLDVDLRDANGTRRLYGQQGEAQGGRGGHARDSARFSFNADGTRLVGVIRDFIGIKVHVWDPATGEKRTELDVPGSTAAREFASGASPDGKLAAVYLSGDTPEVVVLDLDTKGERYSFELLDGLEGAVKPTAVAVSDDGKTVFLGDGGGRVHVWNTETEQEKLVFQAHAGRVTAMILNRDGQRLHTAGGGSIAVWEAPSP